MNPESTHSVKFIVGGKESTQGNFQLFENSDSYRLVLSLGDDTYSAEADDYFEALCIIRRNLESKSIFPVCYGASRNIYPSGMCRGMGGGIKAYQLKLKEPALMKDLVEIFDSSDEIKPVSVDEQEQFFDDWINSLGTLNLTRQ